MLRREDRTRHETGHQRGLMGRVRAGTSEGGGEEVTDHGASPVASRRQLLRSCRQRRSNYFHEGGSYPRGKPSSLRSDFSGNSLTLVPEKRGLRSRSTSITQFTGDTYVPMSTTESSGR